MKESNITASQVHKRNDVHSCVEQFKTNLPNLDSIEHRYVCIPVGWWLSSNDTQYIIECIRAYDKLS